MLEAMWSKNRKSRLFCSSDIKVSTNLRFISHWKQYFVKVTDYTQNKLQSAKIERTNLKISQHELQSIYENIG